MKTIALVAMDTALPGEKGLGRLYYLAEFFCRYGYEVELITSTFQHWEKKFRDPEQVAAIPSACRITLIDEPGYTKNIQFRRIRSYHIMAGNIVQYMENHEYDLVYCLIPDNYIAAEVGEYAKRRGIPYIIDVEDLWPEAMRMVLDVPVLSDLLFSVFTSNAKRAYSLCNGIVGSSDCYRDEPLKYGFQIPNRVTVYVGNDLAVFDAGAAAHADEVKKPENEFWITYTGTLGTSYDIKTLIRAVDLLKRRGEQGIRVMLLGDGPLRNEFETLAAGLSGDVTFMGYMPYEVMAAYLAKSDVTINSLVRRASQSIVSKIGDYLAAGKPMINTGLDREFCDKVTNDGFGVNIEPENAERLAEAILALKNDPEGCAAMGRRARQIGEEQFDRPTSYKKIVELVDGFLQVQRS